MYIFKMNTTICHSDIQNKTNKCVAADLPSAATTFENNTGKASPVYSFSKIKTFYTCKYQYYMNYVLPIEQRPKKHENAFAQYGSFVHEILEKFFSGELAEFELTDYYAENFDIYFVISGIIGFPESSLISFKNLLIRFRLSLLGITTCREDKLFEFDFHLLISVINAK